MRHINTHGNSLIAYLLLAISISMASAEAQIRPEDVATRDQFEEVSGQLVDQLDDAEQPEQILAVLDDVIELKCYFPLEQYDDLFEAVRQKKINAPTPDVRFAAATVSKFLKADISPAQSKQYLAIPELSKRIEKIAESLY